VATARRGEGPTMIEALTYRHKGHSRTDPGTYRPREEVEEWLARDPIPALEKVLVGRGVEPEVLERVRKAAADNVDEHLARALEWPDPDPEARFEGVYA
jgi:acetoin:2,6-dichlorophenolindophenol oxidoreductase subunit alpha